MFCGKGAAKLKKASKAPYTCKSVAPYTCKSVYRFARAAPARVE
jgi:hypothetical protein